MVYQLLPHVKRLYYRCWDLYRYWIGRPDQSVQESVSKKRYNHQLLVAQRCFEACRLDGVRGKRLKKYLKHELFMMFGIGIMFTRLNRSGETDADMEQMWENCRAFDRKWADHFRYRSPLWFVCIPGSFGQWFANFIYRLANKIVRFN